jgi:hypothetical protein
MGGWKSTRVEMGLYTPPSPGLRESFYFLFSVRLGDEFFYSNIISPFHSTVILSSLSV